MHEYHAAGRSRVDHGMTLRESPPCCEETLPCRQPWRACNHQLGTLGLDRTDVLDGSLPGSGNYICRYISTYMFLAIPSKVTADNLPDQAVEEQGHEHSRHVHTHVQQHCYFPWWFCHGVLSWDYWQDIEKGRRVRIALLSRCSPRPYSMALEI